MLQTAKWIAHPVDMGFECPVFQKEFSIPKPVKSATITMTAQGIYYAELNGKRIGDFLFAPGCTSPKRIQVQTYDIKEMLTETNRIQVILSKGWFKGRVNAVAQSACPDLYEALIAEIHIRYQDGTEAYLVTDESWTSSPSKIRFSDFYDGEHYDATFQEQYVPCVVKDYDKSRLVPQQGEEIKEQERIHPLKIFTTPKGETVVDFGQNLTGYFEIQVNAKKGDQIALSVAEVLDKEGNFYTENYRSAKAKYRCICQGGAQVIKPYLAFWGYRYIRVDAFPTEVNLDSITAIVVHSDMKRTGYLETSHPMLSQLFQNIIWGQKGNYLDIPTDCPQRDERLGWTGDAQVFCKTATYNFDVEKFFDKWLADLMLEQFDNGFVPSVVPLFRRFSRYTSAAWADAATICPWQIYLTYGNKAILKRQFPSMCQYLRYIANSTADKYLWTNHNHFGDWLALDVPAGTYVGATNVDFIASVYYAYSTSLVVKAGKVLNRNITKYEKLYEKIISKIRKTFPEYKTQTECVLALYFNIAEDKQAVAKQLAEMIRANGTKLQTGFVGTPYLLHALSQNGYTELAYELLLQDQFPSWLYSVKCGATTIWEHWDGCNENGDFWSKDMNSFNHYAYGSVADWVYEVACGIHTVEEAPAFEKIVIAPQPTDKIHRLGASIETRHGLVSSKWYHVDGKVRYEIITPSDTTIIIEGKEYHVQKGTYYF